jgi:ketosteroid isomerase-like protein
MNLSRIAMLLGVLLAGSASAATPPVSVQQQINTLSDDIVRAADAHDTARHMALFAHDPNLVFAINGRVIHGWDALYAQQLKWWRNGKSDVVYTQSGPAELLPLDVDAVVTTQTLSSRRTGPDGKTSTGSFVVTSIWKKLPQGWRIVYGHESWAR